MSGGNAGEPIGDRELDRLLGLVPPPPGAPADLADRIAARAAATPQLPPRRPPRFARGGVLRRRTLAGAVLGSFLVAIAATAAVLVGHVDFRRLATLPVLLFDRHSHQPPVQSATGPHPASRPAVPSPRPPADHAQSAATVAEGPPLPAVAPAPLVGGERRSTGLAPHWAPPPGLVRDRSPSPWRAHPGIERSRTAAHDRHDERRREGAAEPPRRRAAPRERPPLPRAVATENDTAAANRESLRAAQQSGAKTPEGFDNRNGERAAANDAAVGHRWRGKQRLDWRRRGQGGFGGWHGGGGDADGRTAPLEAGEHRAPTAAETVKPGKAGGWEGAGRRGDRPGKIRQRRR